MPGGPVAELIEHSDEFERERARLLRLGAILELDADELTIRRAHVLDAAGVEPAGHLERLAAELGVTEDELYAWLTFMQANPLDQIRARRSTRRDTQ